MCTRKCILGSVITRWLLMASLLLASCGENPTSSISSPAAGASKQPIRLGGTLPLTGPFSDTGQWIERGYRYWAEQVNAQGGLLGRPVELVIYDDASDADKAVSLFEWVIAQDKVDLVLGGYPGTSAALQMPAAERHRMVYVSMGGHMPSFEQGFSFSFGGPPLMGQWWYEGFWQWLATLPPKDRPRRMATMTLNNVVGLSIRESALGGAARLRLEVVMDDLYDLPLTRAEELVAKAKQSRADLFVASGFLPDGVLTTKAMKLLDYNPSFYLQGIGSLVPAWKKELGEDGDYVFSGTPIHPDLPFPGIKQLKMVTKSRYGLKDTPSYFLFGYAWLQTLQAGVEGAGSLNNTVIRDYLRSHPVVTISGTLEFDERGLPAPYNYLTQVQPTGVELIWPSQVSTATVVYPRPAWNK